MSNPPTTLFPVSLCSSLLSDIYRAMSRIIYIPSVLLSFPVYSFNQRAYRWLRTMVFAVEEINSDPHLLPNLTLGYLAADTCLAESTTLSTALTMVTGLQVSRAGDGCQSAPAVPVIIGDARSSSSMVIADTLGVFDVPMVRTMY